MYEKTSLKLPKNTDLPFFAYGIFKPNELAYSKIEKHVRRHYSCEIDYTMLMRDGVPLITPGYGKTKGALIYFKEESSKEAYGIICDSEPEKLYSWEEIKIGENRANVLMGRNPDLGSSHVENKVGNYSGSKDPLFKEAIEVIENELNILEEKPWDFKYFFKLQMNYLLLWSSIERYGSLKYGNEKIGANNRQLADEKVFKKSLKSFVKDKRTVYSAQDLRVYTLNPDKSRDSIYYYYTIRCNVAHRGKTFHNDKEMLKKSLYELLNIFKDVLKDTFHE